MTEQPSKPDQELEAVDFYCTTIRSGDNPPTLLFVVDIRHTETGHQWTQQLCFDRPQWVSMMQLLAYAAKNEGLEWQPQ